MGVRSDIEDGLAARLMTITAANGYGTDVVNVYYNKIPMGLRLEEYELPALLLIAGNDTIKRQSQCIYGSWQFYIQLIHTDVPDSVMFDFVRDVFKAIYSDSPTADKLDAFKTIHTSIYDIEPIVLEPDLNTIEANRFGLIEINVKYTTKLNQL